MFKDNAGKLVLVWLLLTLLVSFMETAEAHQNHIQNHGTDTYVLGDKERIVIQYVDDNIVLTHWKDHKPSFYRPVWLLSEDGVITFKHRDSFKYIEHHYMGDAYFDIDGKIFPVL